MHKRKKYNLIDIARMADVSTATVSRVLNRNPNVKVEIKRRVEEVVKQLDYKPPHKASFNSNSITVGVVVPDIANPWFPLLVKGIENTARVHGFAITLCDSNNDPEIEKKQLSSLMDRGVDGLILIPTDSSGSRLRELAEGYVPVVFLDRDIDHPGTHYVTSDNEGGAYQAAKYLISLGHRSILYLGGRTDINTEPQRYAGFRRALEEAGISPDSHAHLLGEYSFDKARELVAKVAHHRPRFTAIFASDDFMALGAKQALEERGLRVPQDVSLVGFDDIPFASLISLTTISQPAFELGKSALLLLNDVMNKRVVAPQKIVLPTSIIIRGSCVRI